MQCDLDEKGLLIQANFSNDSKSRDIRGVGRTSCRRISNTSWRQFQKCEDCAANAPGSTGQWIRPMGKIGALGSLGGRPLGDPGQKEALGALAAFFRCL